MTNRNRPPRHITEDQIVAIQADLHRAIDAICARWLTVQTRAVDWARHYPTGGTEPVGGTHVTDAMAERIATELDNHRPVNDPGNTALQWLWKMFDIPADLFLLQLQAEDMVPKQPERKRDSDIGKCECCERDVARTTADPLKGGLCRKCYEAWQRAKASNIDRGSFMSRRRHMLGVGIKASA